MAGKGGARIGAGRKPVAEEKKVTELIIKALKGYHSVDTDEDAKIKFINDLYSTQRGQIFLAEHLFGKPKETIDQNVTIDSFSLKDVISFDKPKSNLIPPPSITTI
jgi:hypothetical protein